MHAGNVQSRQLGPNLYHLRRLCRFRRCWGGGAGFLLAEQKTKQQTMGRLTGLPSPPAPASLVPASMQALKDIRCCWNRQTHLSLDFQCLFYPRGDSCSSSGSWLSVRANVCLGTEARHGSARQAHLPFSGGQNASLAASLLKLVGVSPRVSRSTAA